MLSGFNSETHFVIVKLESKFLQSCTKSDRNQTDIHSIHFQLISFTKSCFCPAISKIKTNFLHGTQFLLQHLHLSSRNIAFVKIPEENAHARKSHETFCMKLMFKQLFMID